MLSVSSVASASTSTPSPPLLNSVSDRFQRYLSLVKQEPKNGMYKWELGKMLLIMRKEEEAVELMLNGLQLEAKLVQGPNMMAIADIYRGLGRIDEAIWMYSNAAMVDPLQTTPYIFMGLSLEYAGRYVDASRLFFNAIRLNPKITSYRLFTTSSLLKSGQRMRALSEFTKYSRELGWNRGVLLGQAESDVVWDGFHDEGFKFRDAFKHLYQSNGIQIDDSDEIKFNNLLTHLQFPSSCDQSRLLLYDFSQAFGMGAQIHMMSLALTAAIWANRTLVPSRRHRWWLTPQHCHEGDSRCYLQPFTHCSPPEDLASPTHHVPRLSLDPNARDRIMLFDYDTQNQFMKEHVLQGWVPATLQHRGALWFRSHIVRFLMKLTPTLENEIERRKEKMGWPKDPKTAVISVHVRHGDKLKEANRFPFRAFVPLLRSYMSVTMERLVKTVYVYVATDSPEVVKNCRDLEREGGFQCLIDEEELRGTDITNANVLHHLEMDIDKYATEALVTAVLIGSTTLFLGTFSSNMGRLGYELMVASCKQTAHAVAVSLDRPWFLYP